MTDPSLDAGPELMGSNGWTEEDFLALDVHHSRTELIDGGLWVSPGPTWRHQTITHNLVAALKPPARDAGLKVSDGVNVRLAHRRILVPDLVVADLPEPGLLTPAANFLLVGEVTSPSNAVTDRHLKPLLYAAAGIPWYLTVEPDFHGYHFVNLHIFRLDGDRYVEHAVATPGETLILTEPFTVALDSALLLAD